jgi:DNA-binding NtrC family response regulator
VDDEKEFAGYMTKRLKRNEIDVHTYTNPVEALRRAEGQRYDVALLDLKMPEMDGEQLLNRLKERDPTIEVIFLTGHGTVTSAFRSAQGGAYEYLLKPCEFVDLIRAINNAYAKRIRAMSAEQGKQADELMQRADEVQPLDVLNQLENIRDGRESPPTGATRCEGDDSQAGAASTPREAEQDGR